MPNQKPRQNSPIKRSSSHAQSQAGKGGRKAPRASQSKRTIRSNGRHGKAVSKSKSVGKTPPGFTGPQFSLARVELTLGALEGIYGKSAEARGHFDSVVKRPTQEAISLIALHDWSTIESIVGCVAKSEREALIRAAISHKQYLNREAAAQKRDNSRKTERSEKPDPVRRRVSSRRKSKV